MKPMKPRAAGGPHEMLAELMEECGGVVAAADFEGVSKFTLYKELDPDQPAEMPFIRVARLSSKFGAHAPAQYFARLAGGTFIALDPAVAPGTQLGRLSGQVLAEVGQMIEKLGAIVEDGAIAGKEPDEFDREANEAITKIMELKLQVRAEAAAKRKVV